MEKTEGQIYEEFVTQLSSWAKTGTIPSAGNQDIRYGLTLQKKRLDQYGVRMEYKLMSRGDRSGHVASAEFCSEKYSNKLAWKAYLKEISYYRENKKCLSKKTNELFYAIITWLNHDDRQAVYCCPNCGAISEVGQLLEGCPYCHTQFLMSDLFPKVTNYYFLPDYGLGKTEGNSMIKKWMTAGGLVGLALSLPGQMSEILHGSLILALFLMALAGGIGSVMGYFALSISMLVRVFKGCFQQTPKAMGIIGARKKLTEFMKPYDPGFSFEYFLGKVQSLLKIFIFAEDRSSLAIYEGQAEARSLDNVVDAQFGGAVSLNSCRVEGDYCYLDLNAYMDNVYCDNGRIRQKSEKFQIGLCRNIRYPQDYGFSIKKVSCRHCGASFDATSERLCPYCKSIYELKEDDWVITYIKKR